MGSLLVRRRYKKRLKSAEAIGYLVPNGPGNSRQQNNEYEYLQIEEVRKKGGKLVPSPSGLLFLSIGIINEFFMHPKFDDLAKSQSARHCEESAPAGDVAIS